MCVTEHYSKNVSFRIIQWYKDNPIVVPEGAPSFLASVVTVLEDRDDPAFATFPAYSPEPNPVGRGDDGCTLSGIGSDIPAASY